MGAVAEFMEQGGAFMYIIAFILVIALAVAIERFIFLYFRFNINASTFMKQIIDLVGKNQVDRAVKYCNAAGNAALAKVVSAGLKSANQNEMEIANAIEEESLRVIPQVQKRTDSLTVLAQIATYLGLLGTIFGMIAAFDAVASAAPEQKATALAAAISIAMNTTAFGLIVAIPCMALHLFLSGLTTKIIQEIDEHSVRIQNLLVRRSRGSNLD